MKTLLLIPSYAKTNIDADVAEDRHPTMDYHCLVAALGADPADSVEMLDYASVDQDRHPGVQLLCKLAGRDAALALMGFLRRNSCDTIFTNAEKIALPLAVMLRTVLNRPRHVTIAHRLTAKKKQPFYKWLKLFREMDVIFVYSSAQYVFARTDLGIPSDSLSLIPFHADHRFFRPLREITPRENEICAAGLEWRDYPTLIRAVTDMKQLAVRLAAASPWCKQPSELHPESLPEHISNGSYNYLELRTLYAESSFVVVPLCQNDFQAGVTTILEAMAMGKAVIVSGTVGQTDVIAHEQNGLYVEPGDAEGLSRAIQRLCSDSVLRGRLGRSARRWVEENATLDRWVEHIVAGLRGSSSRVRFEPRESTVIATSSPPAPRDESVLVPFGALLAAATRRLS